MFRTSRFLPERTRHDMSVMTLEGVVENGQIRLPASVHLPEKARVYVVIPDTDVRPAAHIASPHLANPAQAADFEKEVVEDALRADV
jgi:hypothetical protein